MNPNCSLIREATIAQMKRRLIYGGFLFNKKSSALYYYSVGVQCLSSLFRGKGGIKSVQLSLLSF